MSPTLSAASAGCVVVIDGMLIPTWGWASEGTTMFSGKHRDTGFNLQIAATPAGELLAVSAPDPGSRHDTYAWRRSSFPEVFADRESMGDLGYIGTGMLTARRKPPGHPAAVGGDAGDGQVVVVVALVELCP
ncbi:transposase family protein [Streptomyces sp. NPDC056661]|uniref:transposase family protein n=1 Tax=Streptomyces sp. NPDC056661 TaxID=3345898 RepID=UPI00369916E2